QQICFASGIVIAVRPILLTTATADSLVAIPGVVEGPTSRSRASYIARSTVVRIALACVTPARGTARTYAPASKQAAKFAVGAFVAAFAAVGVGAQERLATVG